MIEYILPDKTNEQLRAIDEGFNGVISQIKRDQEKGDSTSVDTSTLALAWQVAKYWHKDLRSPSGQLFLYHPLAVFKRMYQDGFTTTPILVASLLHDTVENNTGYTFELMAADFGSEVAEHVRAITRLSSTTPATRDEWDKLQEEYDKRISNAEGKDCASIYIKFADRLDNLYSTKGKTSEELARYINHTQRILIPLAKKLGCFQIAELLADGCFYIKNPKIHENIQVLLSKFVQNSIEKLNKTQVAIKNACGDTCLVSGLGKGTITPTPRKISRAIKNLNPYALQTRDDLFSFVGYKPYTTLYIKLNEANDEEPLISQVFKLIKPLLHDLIIDVFDDKLIDNDTASIKLEDMHHNVIKLMIIRRDFHSFLAESSSLSTRSYSADSKIQIFTKDGHVLELDKGITVLDLAFILNTEIGASYQGAIVNDNYVEPDYKLQSNDKVVIQRYDGGYSARLNWFTILESKIARARLYEFFKKASEKYNIDIFSGIYKPKS